MVFKKANAIAQLGHKYRQILRHIVTQAHFLIIQQLCSSCSLMTYGMSNVANLNLYSFAY